MPATAKITKRSTMQQALEAYPSAQWYEPEDILEEVAHLPELG